MQTIQKAIKEVLKLRKPQDVAMEINELEIYKSAYRHFLASYEASQNPENEIAIERNLETVKRSLRVLYVELKEIEAGIKAVVAPQPVVRNLISNEDEIKAIMLFNQDKRFTITE